MIAEFIHTYISSFRPKRSGVEKPAFILTAQSTSTPLQTAPTAPHSALSSPDSPAPTTTPKPAMLERSHHTESPTQALFPASTLYPTPPSPEFQKQCRPQRQRL